MYSGPVWVYIWTRVTRTGLLWRRSGQDEYWGVPATSWQLVSWSDYSTVTERVTLISIYLSFMNLCTVYSVQRIQMSRAAIYIKMERLTNLLLLWQFWVIICLCRFNSTSTSCFNIRKLLLCIILTKSKNDFTPKTTVITEADYKEPGLSILVFNLSEPWCSKHE